MPLQLNITPALNTAPVKSDRISAVLTVLDSRYVDYDTYKSGSISPLQDHLAFIFKKSLLFTNDIMVDASDFCHSPLIKSVILSPETEEKEALGCLFAEKSIRLLMSCSPEKGRLTPGSNGLADPTAKAASRYFDSIGMTVSCCSIQPDEERVLAERFVTELQRLKFSTGRHNAVLGMLVRLQPFVRDRIAPELFFGRLRRIISDIEGDTCGITDIYARHIYKSGINDITDTYQVSPDVFAVKLLIDSIYNENLPSYFGLSAFIPNGMPTARQLGLRFMNKHIVMKDNPEVCESYIDKLERYICHHNHNGRYPLSQEDRRTVLGIPYEGLRLSDIAAIRRTDEWHRFSAEMTMYLCEELDIVSFMECYYSYVLFINRYAEEHKIEGDTGTRIPVIIEEIVMLAERVTVIFSIVFDACGCIGGYQGQMYLALGDFRSLLRELLDGEENIGVIKGLSMLHTGTVTTLGRSNLDMKQHIRFGTCCMSSAQKTRYIRALLRLTDTDGVYIDVHSDTVAN
jgi:hypothetical protein